MLYRRIRDLREDHDLKQKTLADYLNCTQSCYSLYESGKHDIPTVVLCKLADFYQTSIDYLLERTDEPAPLSQGEKVRLFRPQASASTYKNAYLS